MLSRSSLDPRTQLEVELVNHYKILKRHSSRMPVGFQSVIAKYQGLLTKHQNEEHQLVLVTGNPGCGKSCLMSHLARTSGNLLGTDIVVVLRYLSDMNPPYNSTDLFLSICEQISFALKIPIESSPAKSPAEMRESFGVFLTTVAKVQQSIIIVLDGLDTIKVLPNQSSSENNKKFDWLLMKLPKNVHIVASLMTSVRTEEDLVRIKDKLFYSENIMTIPSLEENHVTQIVKDLLKENHRRLQQDQLDSVLNAVKGTGSPLLLDLLMKDAMTWTPDCHFEVPDSIVDVVHSVS